jgi:large subunit ribosomal protein L18
LEKQDARLKRHKRIRKKISGTKERPRLSVFKSLKHIYAQIINDEEGVTLLSSCTLSPEIKEALHEVSAERSEQIQYGGNITASKIVGEFLAKKALEKGIKSVVFDRGGYIYHGRVKALAEAAREAGLQF